MCTEVFTVREPHVIKLTSNRRTVGVAQAAAILAMLALGGTAFAVMGVRGGMFTYIFSGMMLAVAVVFVVQGVVYAIKGGAWRVHISSDAVWFEFPDGREYYLAAEEINRVVHRVVDHGESSTSAWLLYGRDGTVCIQFDDLGSIHPHRVVDLVREMFPHVPIVEEFEGRGLIKTRSERSG